MSSLEGKTIATTYKDLLQVSNNNIGIDDVIRSVEDGEGTASALSLSTDTIEIHGNILPHTNSTYDIGSADKKIRHLYLSDNSLYIGDLQFSNVDLQEVKNLRSGAFATSAQGALAESAIQPGSFSFSDLDERPTTLTGYGIVDAATAAQGDKATSALQPGDSIPFSVIDAKPTSLGGYGIVDGANSIQGERADSALQPGDNIHVNTMHLSGGVIYGPAVMYIDPTGIGDNTGKVCIMGDLQIDGTTTTVNSTTLSVSGKTMNLCDGATSASESDGAGVHVTGGEASMLYNSVSDQWLFNKSVGVKGWINAEADDVSTDAVINLVASNDSTYTSISRIKSIAESDSNSTSALTFYTRDTTNNIAEKMRIDSAGKVGIGTTTPDALLDVEGSLDQLNSASIVNNSSTGYGLVTKGGGNGKTRYIADFRDKDNSSCLKIDGDGNVGIGTTSPDYKLDVNGDFNVSVGDGTINDMCLLNGTVATTSGNNTVTGTNTNFTTELVTGDKVYINLVTYTITNIASDTTMTVEPPTGTTSGAGFYRVTKKQLIFADKLTTNVGIGTTVPDSPLHIEGTGARIKISNSSGNARAYPGYIDGSDNGQAYFYDSSSTERIRLNTAGATFFTGGKVGIGTTSPERDLHVKTAGQNQNGVIKIGGTNASLGLDISYDQALATTTKIISNPAYDNVGAKMHIAVDGDTNPNQLVLKGDGNIGIGTASPDAVLDISTNQTTGLRLINPDNSGANVSKDPPAIVFQAKGWDTDAGTRAYSARIRVNSNYSGAADRGNTHPVMNFDLETNEDDPDDTLSTKMMINADGKVGIGTTSPGAYTLNLAAAQQEFVQKIGNNHSSSAYGMYIEFTGDHDDKTSEYIRCSTNGNTLINFKVYSDGTVFSDGSSLGSDDRIKHNEEIIVNAVETLSKITPKKYFKTTKLYDTNHDFDLDSNGNPIDENGEPVNHRVEAGVIAQEVLGVDELKFAVTPETKDEDGNVTTPYALNYNSLFTYAIAAIKEQQTIIEDLEARIETLENK